MFHFIIKSKHQLEENKRCFQTIVENYVRRLVTFQLFIPYATGTKSITCVNALHTVLTKINNNDIIGGCYN